MRWGLTTEAILNSKFIIRSIICGIWGQIVGIDCKKRVVLLLVYEIMVYLCIVKGGDRYARPRQMNENMK